MISKCLYAAIPVFLIFSGCALDISDVMDSSAEIPKDRKLDGHLMASLLILVLIVLEFVYSYYKSERDYFRRKFASTKSSADSAKKLLNEKTSSLVDLERQYNALRSELEKNEKARELLLVRMESIKHQLEDAYDYESGKDKDFMMISKGICALQTAMAAKWTR